MLFSLPPIAGLRSKAKRHTDTLTSTRDTLRVREETQWRKGGREREREGEKSREEQRRETIFLSSSQRTFLANERLVIFRISFSLHLYPIVPGVFRKVPQRDANARLYDFTFIPKNSRFETVAFPGSGTTNRSLESCTVQRQRRFP